MNRVILPISLKSLGGYFVPCRHNHHGEPGVAEEVNKKFSFASKSIYEEMILHCMQELPYEACGLLSGTERIFQTVWKLENINRSPISFMMDIEQVRQVLTCIEERGETLLGIYHSHPTAKPFPSPQDIAYCNYSDVAYIIVSFSNNYPEIGCFQITGNRAVPIEVLFR